MTIQRHFPACILATLILSGCQKELLRDDLSEVRDVMVSYTVPEGREFGSSIATMRWLVYNEEGHFFRELSMEPKQYQYFGTHQLPDGNYTVVNIANSTSRTQVESYETLDQLMLRANTQQPEGWYDNVDCLFWQMREIEVKEGSVTTVNMPMADIHCHLHVHVGWKGLPQQRGDWTIHLSDVNVAYHAGRKGLTIAGVEHPEVAENLGEHRISVVPLNFELDGEFIVYRWTDSRVPKLQVRCNGEPVTPLMDIGTVFDEWKWSPDNTVAQDYWLGVQINADGSADIQTWGRARVADWIDGGIIGT